MFFFTGKSVRNWCLEKAKNKCTFSTQYKLNTDGYYGVEWLYMTCTHSLSNLTAVITVQRTVGADFAQQYNNFFSGVIEQSYKETPANIVYAWRIKPGQVIEPNGTPYFFEAQFQLKGVNQTVGDDTYLVHTRSACNNEEIHRFNHFWRTIMFTKYKISLRALPDSECSTVWDAYCHWYSDESRYVRSILGDICTSIMAEDQRRARHFSHHDSYVRQYFTAS